MDYKEKVIALLNSQELSKEQKEKLESIFPELRESEDEKIRKWIIGVLSTYEHDRDLRDAAIAWLEKQGEKGTKGNERKIPFSEQNPADKVEPKFKVGDTIIKKHNSDILYFGSFTITDITGGKYWYNDRIICDITEQDEWELVEKKPNIDQHSLPVSDNSSLPTFDESIYHPCTEEVYEQKTAWSEDDENLFKSCITRIQMVDSDATLIDWLKSLKDRYTWEPSDEQMRVLDLAIRCGINRGTTEETTLVSLFNDLKKIIKL